MDMGTPWLVVHFGNEIGIDGQALAANRAGTLSLGAGVKAVLAALYVHYSLYFIGRGKNR